MQTLQITSLKTSRFIQSLASGEAFTPGSLYNIEQIKLSDLALIPKNTPEKLPPSLKRLSFMAGVLSLKKEEVPYCKTLPQIYSETPWKDMNEADLKRMLPAIVPSVEISMADFWKVRKGKESPKKMVRSQASFWKHTGLFGMDIDLGKGGNPDNYEGLVPKLKALKETPFGKETLLISYMSPSGGLKLILKGATPDLFSDNLEERLEAHYRMYALLEEKLYEACGLVADSSCKDVARLQFLWFSEHFIVYPDPVGLSISSEDLKQHTHLHDPEAQRKRFYLGKEGATTGELPEIVSKEFSAWLSKSGRPIHAETVKMMRLNDGKYVSECPCCKDVCRGSRSDLDLALYIDRDDLASVKWHCFHGSCSDPKLVTHPMWRLWDLFMDEKNSEDVLPNEGGVKGKTSGVIPPPVIYGCEGAARKFVEGLSMDMFDPVVHRAPGICNPWSDTKETKEGDIVPTPVPINAVGFIKKCCGVQFFKADNFSGVVYMEDTYEKRICPVMNREALAINLATLATEYFKCYKKLIFAEALTVLIEEAPVIDPVAVLAQDEWDGVDRITPLVNTITPQENWKMDGNGSLDTKEFIMNVIKSWMEATYIRSYCSSFNYQPKGGFYTNILPILVGPQGCFKNRWVRSLFGDARKWISESGYIDPESKDTLFSLVKSTIVHLDEIDAITCREKDTAALKSLLTKTVLDMRLPYTPDIKTFVTRASFIGSTNHSDFLVDETGNRRFYSIFISGIDMDAMEAIDKQQLWSQIRYNCETDKEAGSSYKFEKASILNNRTNVVRKSGDEYLVEGLVYVDEDDLDNEGNPLRNHIPASFTASKNILRLLRVNEGREGRDPSRGESIAFKRNIEEFVEQSLSVRYGDSTEGLKMKTFDRCYNKGKYLRGKHRGIMPVLTILEAIEKGSKEFLELNDL